MTHPNSLYARVLHGKCYHNFDFFLARKKRNSSHIWRAILVGREAIQKGLIKWIADRSSIIILDEPWIPLNYGFKPLFQPTAALDTKVTDHLLPYLSDWDEQKLASNRYLVYVRAVKFIPLGKCIEDSWAWVGSKHGTFTEMSDLRLISSGRSINVDQPSRSKEDILSWWPKLWKLKVPPKVRFFQWRVIHYFIPSHDVLRRRHMEQIALCEACGDEHDTAFHAMTRCTWAGLF